MGAVSSFPLDEYNSSSTPTATVSYPVEAADCFPLTVVVAVAAITTTTATTAGGSPSTELLLAQRDVRTLRKSPHDRLATASASSSSLNLDSDDVTSEARTPWCLEAEAGDSTRATYVYEDVEPLDVDLLRPVIHYSRALADTEEGMGAAVLPKVPRRQTRLGSLALQLRKKATRRAAEVARRRSCCCRHSAPLLNLLRKKTV